MNKVLSLAYFAGGSKFTLDPFLALKNSRHDLKMIFTKSPKRTGDAPLHLGNNEA